MILNAGPILDGQQVLGCVVTLTDITARKQSEAALRSAAEQFRGLVEQAIAGIYIIQDGKLIYVNPRFAEIMGQGPMDELIGSDPLGLIAEADRGRVADALLQLLGGEAQSIALEFGSMRRDGVMIQVGVNGARATHQGRPAVIGMLQDISEKRRAEEEIQRYIERLQSAVMSTVEVATKISEMRDPYTAGHERRVAGIAVAIGAELGFDANRQTGLRIAGQLHDIGKITVPSEILSKPGKLSAIELQLVQGHTQAGYDVLKSVEWSWPVAQVALQHHERMDGSGYPQGLKGEAILLEARIMAVADVVEAMASHRPYRAALGTAKALAEIQRGRGTGYDADVVDACLRVFGERRYELS
ncbi:MAG: HD-GYP domain-containing protein [Steroidobacteraceae bacterium]